MAATHGGRGNVPANEIAIILQRLKDGEHQHDIAAEYHTNQGRLSELKTGKRTTFKDMRP
ncbi:hypothetical protein ACLEIY_16325 [Acetobacter tropicalis]|uniref:hypothetical protein n=1 Tax=Acetobacter tropicalis TaxID=104102 RepID=UPI003974A8F7